MMLHIRLAIALVAGAALARAQVLRNFQVATPPPVPKDAKTCTVTVVDHTFAASYYQPALMPYTPPTDCGAPGSWAAVTLNLTVTSNGTQFDRLAIMSLQDTEIWRTSTAEPTRAGIVWSYAKDVTKYVPLFAAPGVFNMELNNVVDGTYTGLFATTVVATFYASSAKNPPAGKADLIVPIGLVREDGGAEASVPPGFSKNVTLPKNSVAVYAELYASGNSEEEFWYFNAADEYIGDLPDGITYGHGPFREVRILVDGQLAGVAYPYATIFTGGIVPTAWRPIPSYGAFDLPSYFLDLTPFVPVFADGLPHNITIDVASAEADHTINDNWYVSGNLQVVTDPSGKPTTGKITAYSAPAYASAHASATLGTNGDVNITVAADHNIRIAATINAGSGKTTSVLFTQNMQFENVQSYLNDSYIQIVKQTAKGSVLSLHNGIPVLSDVFSYPLEIDYTTLTADGRSWKSTFDHSYNRVLLPTPYILGTTTNEHQYTTGFFIVASTGNSGNGTSDNSLNYVDLKGNTYSRQVGASLNNITYDRESGSLAGGRSPFQFPFAALQTVPERMQVRLPGGRSH